ncbi:conserved hypothetical protein [uncultured Pleomorphomonas sp.]|uniref:Uncharacterized protein n=2 Tax=uncultured Pleomorphomonas sp. TaxID=442121 RepID=A0A212LIR2_9HYPH|nr:conserved hypothetical protein [uncultured Pleomorphomonas sp.]
MSLAPTDKFLRIPYVGLMRVLRRLIWRGDRFRSAPRPASRTGLWLRSLFAIYDIDEMNRLDLAWWQLDGIARVGAFLDARPGARVFEYGSGASTLWLSRRAGTVISVEHVSSWAAVVRNLLVNAPHVCLLEVPGEPINDGNRAYASDKPRDRGLAFHNYVHAIDGEEPFDLIIIDGRCRSLCLGAAKAHLKPDGLIVFDNSGRRRYRDAIDGSGMKVERLRGLTACLPYPDETTLLRFA